MTTYELNEEEDKDWIKLFSNFKNEGLSDIEADKKAFKELIKKYPHISKYNNIK